MKRILIIEDDRGIVELARYNLASEGFQARSRVIPGGSGSRVVRPRATVRLFYNGTRGAKLRIH